MLVEIKIGFVVEVPDCAVDLVLFISVNMYIITNKYAKLIYHRYKFRF